GVSGGFGEGRPLGNQMPEKSGRSGSSAAPTDTSEDATTARTSGLVHERPPFGIRSPLRIQRLERPCRRDVRRARGVRRLLGLLAILSRRRTEKQTVSSWTILKKRLGTAPARSDAGSAMRSAGELVGRGERALELGVQLAAEQYEIRRKIEPHHQDDRRRDRAESLVVAAEARDVQGEQRRADEPQHDRDRGSVDDRAPARTRARRRVAVKHAENTDAHGAEQRPSEPPGEPFEQRR